MMGGKIQSPLLDIHRHLDVAVFFCKYQTGQLISMKDRKHLSIITF